MTLEERRIVGRIQNLIGRAKGEHHNDRNPNHIEAVEQPLSEAFDACVALLSKYPVIRERKAGG